MDGWLHCRQSIRPRGRRAAASAHCASTSERDRGAYTCIMRRGALLRALPGINKAVAMPPRSRGRMRSARSGNPIAPAAGTRARDDALQGIQAIFIYTRQNVSVLCSQACTLHMCDSESGQLTITRAVVRVLIGTIRGHHTEETVNVWFASTARATEHLTRRQIVTTKSINASSRSQAVVATLIHCNVEFVASSCLFDMFSDS